MSKSKRRIRHPSARDLVHALINLQESIVPLQDMEVVVLKSHLMAEVLLRFILAERLDIAVETLPSLQFPPLVILSLGGPGKRQLKKDLLRLNELRNDFAHEVLETANSPDMWSFVKRWRAAKGKRRFRWVHFAKLRFLKLNYSLLIEGIKLAVTRISDTEKEEMAKTLPPEGRFLLENPDAAWIQLNASPPKWKTRLISPEWVVDAASASRAVVDGVSAYDAILEKLAELYKAGTVSEENVASIKQEAEVVRAHGRVMVATTEAWRKLTLQDDFAVAYVHYIAGIEKLRERITAP